ncbi:YaaC family protein [Cronobacter dublinensis]
MSSEKIERFVATDVNGAIWLRLKRLTSAQLCKKIIENNNPELEQNICIDKSIGMSSVIRSAIGYWETENGGLNSKILSRYYALLQISLAEQISSGDPKDNLKNVQKHTESGHGLYICTIDDEKFPDNIKIGCLRGGHFYAYAKKIGIDIRQYASERRPRTSDELNKAYTFSLTDLLRRIPELRPFLAETVGEGPLSFQIGHASRNMILRSRNSRARIQDGSINTKTEFSGFTYAAIYPKGYQISLEELSSFGFEIVEIEKEAEYNTNISDEEYFVGKVYHPENEIWWDYVTTHKSGYCGTSIIVPFWGTQDPFVLHLIVLYAFSIIVRYFPDTWYEIENGEYDYIRSLLENYLVIFDSVLPKLAVERLTNVHLVVTSPDSMNSPI